MIDYDGRSFRNTGYPAGEDAPIGHYRQEGDLLWADFDGGPVRRGSLNGRVESDGNLEFAYTMVLADGEVIAGRCWSTPEFLDDGRIRLNERWERYGAHSDSGESALEEVRT
ncbi:hypothetical protein OG373_20220 [Streptomyces avidinii]|uniref:N-acetylglutamate synthase n=1 Tax=Streptomyces virginiae TaxID=1961 RepID=A0A0L8N6H1_STRVG|nr:MULTISPECIES: hypothetical protein [Streptomyces]ARE75612.1 hypothetical protein B6R96_17970 [Streptomyces sp. Sge12]KOG58105.1 hypothetical protein ADK75_01615 [Streptomyces virginiae]WST46381.1 hypothetical protein OG592_20200 [Streptomyces avidinii]WTA98526.1 hypothetical protein OG373_20220 [Streptomyces avidinii]